MSYGKNKKENSNDNNNFPQLSLSARPLLPNIEYVKRRSSSISNNNNNNNFNNSSDKGGNLIPRRPSTTPHSGKAATPTTHHPNNHNNNSNRSASVSIVVEEVSPQPNRSSTGPTKPAMSKRAAANGNKVVNYSAFLPPSEGGSKPAKDSTAAASAPAPSKSEKEENSRNTFSLSTDSYVPQGTGGFMEGPLPPEVREIIHKTFVDYSQSRQNNTDELIDEAERQARRLLSSYRRARVYREELQAAEAEVQDLLQLLQNAELVCHALEEEEAEIDERILQLQREKELIQQQRQQEGRTRQRQADKVAEAEERQAVLQRTVEAITHELQSGTLSLRQLVPNLYLDNYA
ncbi:hypothetical protein ADEAN_000705600 [Angomonas deanei]|uniref:Uncharacterized protein n=1 Tax=Angomonas deanei TaxID=59799 RepID=A0A7G2CI69_9TRYP|nr:hypothetical protein ADEAN_000705600 [Angomonas deanei]